MWLEIIIEQLKGMNGTMKCRVFFCNYITVYLDSLVVLWKLLIAVILNYLNSHLACSSSMNYGGI